ncbi:M48 family metallopeptidase [Desulfosoma caldarium]|uniref:Zn-dependent protease with chaperone function n=1 Tax=Desulfosoma caldarium TaxID=610254 RepID=A0A3N1UTN5_9BACT|nr:M48 family metallopeptidase [Desulfosoma caldarium]ROQ93513.1 Zn-dependent protease with chaperone function [Desulfosoma caldarium]
MYGQILSFIVALTLFSLHEPGHETLRPPVKTLSLTVAVFAAFFLLCAVFFGRLQASLKKGATPGRVYARFIKLQSHLTVLALGFLAVQVFVFNIKDFFQWIPGFARSTTLSGLVGLVLFLLHLAAIWFWAYPLHRRLTGSMVSRRAYVQGQFGFYTALLLPWFFIALLLDALQWVPLPPFFASDLGHLVLFGAVFALFLCLAPPIIVRLWRCSSVPASPLRDRLEAFCQSQNFRLGDFLLWPPRGGEHLSAAVLGILPRFRYILITRGLLQLLNEQELKAVVAHEMGHVKRFHALFYLSLFLAYAAASYALHDMILLMILREKWALHWALSQDTFYRNLFSLLYSLPVLAVLVLYFRYLFGYFMRNCERQADLFALKTLGDPYPLVSSLQKIAFHSGQIDNVPSWHHYSIRERVHMLLAAAENPELMAAHNRKLWRSAAVFFLALTLLIHGAIQFRYSNKAQAWRQEIQLHILEAELQLDKKKPELYMAYSALLLQRQRYHHARLILEEGLRLAPNHSGILNNLAWLYATAPPPYRHPSRALELALRAAAIQPDPYVLDTLAEAYYVNGRYAEALETIRRAIAQKPERLRYYVEQEEKFKDALKKVPP